MLTVLPTPDVPEFLADNIAEFERRRILREVARKRKFLPVTVKENLAWDDVSRLAVNTPELPGVAIDVGSSRLYPDAAQIAHIVQPFHGDGMGIAHIFLFAENGQPFLKAQLEPIAAGDAVARPVMKIFMGHHTLDIGVYTAPHTRKFIDTLWPA